MRIYVIEEVPHIMIEHTSLGHLECWPMWYVDYKIISVLVVVGHQIILLDQTYIHDVGYPLVVIPDRIGISGEVTNFVGVYHSYITMYMYKCFHRRNLSYLVDISIDECVACQPVVEEATISINSVLCCGIQDDISHVNCAGITLFRLVISRICLWDLLC